MRRFTILALMGLVLALAVSLAALRGANDHWAGGLLMATPLLFGLALIGALCGGERARSERIGFVVLGWGYFALAFLGLSEDNLAKLPTSRLLHYVHEQVAGSRTFSVILTGTSTSASGGPAALTLTKAPATLDFTGTPYGLTRVTGVIDEAIATNARPANRWRAMLPGAANNAAFQAVGHCLFALLAGLLGAIVARRFERRRHTEATP